MNEPPVLSEMDRLRVELAIAQYDCAQLRLARLQDDATKARETLEAIIQTMTREGYTLNRDAPTGQWTYVRAPAAAPRLNGKDDGAGPVGVTVLARGAGTDEGRRE